VPTADTLAYSLREILMTCMYESEGRTAWKYGLAFSANPYTRLSRAWHKWNRGWELAAPIIIRVDGRKTEVPAGHQLPMFVSA